MNYKDKKLNSWVSVELFISISIITSTLYTLYEYNFGIDQSELIQRIVLFLGSLLLIYVWRLRTLWQLRIELQEDWSPPHNKGEAKPKTKPEYESHTLGGYQVVDDSNDEDSTK